MHRAVLDGARHVVNSEMNSAVAVGQVGQPARARGDTLSRSRRRCGVGARTAAPTGRVRGRSISQSSHRFSTTGMSRRCAASPASPSDIAPMFHTDTTSGLNAIERSRRARAGCGVRRRARRGRLRIRQHVVVPREAQLRAARRPRRRRRRPRCTRMVGGQHRQGRGRASRNRSITSRQISSYPP